MFKRFLIIVVGVFALNACAGLGVKKDYNVLAANRSMPVFFENGETAVAFKAQALIREVNLEGVLIVKKIEPEHFTVKMLGPMGAKIVDAEMVGHKISYNYVLPDINSGVIKSRFEKFIYCLILPPGEIKKAKYKKDGVLEVKRAVVDGTALYVYDDGMAYPSKMSRGSISILYDGYEPYFKAQLPYSINYLDTFAEVSLDLSLISVR